MGKMKSESTCKCGERHILMSGYIEVYQDPEPYNNGVEEEAAVSALERDITVYFCPKCNNIIDITL